MDLGAHGEEVGSDAGLEENKKVKEEDDAMDGSSEEEVVAWDVWVKKRSGWSACICNVQ